MTAHFSLSARSSISHASVHSHTLSSCTASRDSRADCQQRGCSKISRCGATLFGKWCLSAVGQAYRRSRSIVSTYCSSVQELKTNFHRLPEEAASARYICKMMDFGSWSWRMRLRLRLRCWAAEVSGSCRDSNESKILSDDLLPWPYLHPRKKLEVTSCNVVHHLPQLGP